jgi:hypothetical protein
MVCWAISQFCANDLEAQVDIAEVGVIQHLVFLLGHDTVDDLSKTTKAMYPGLQVCEVFVNFLLPSLLLEFILVA